MGKWMRSILYFLFPDRCPVCDDIIEPENIGKRRIHQKCERKLVWTGNIVCLHCGRPVKMDREYCYDCGKKNLKDGFLQGKSLFLYQGAIRTSMYRFKYSNKREYASFFAEEALRLYGEWMRTQGIEAIVPVPMYGPKQRRRGYNQAECFAKALAEKTGIPMERLVERIRDTAPQKGLNDIQREKNLKDAFLCKKIEQRKKVLLVDDIYTTGSTADKISEELLKSGADRVFFLSICIGKGM